MDLLRQRSRPYLFSNTVAPAIVGASIAVLDLLSASTVLRDKLENNTHYFRQAMTAAGFNIIPGEHPIVPVMLYDAPLSQRFANRLLEEGIYVIGFFFSGGAQRQSAYSRADVCRTRPGGFGKGSGCFLRKWGRNSGLFKVKVGKGQIGKLASFQNRQFASCEFAYLPICPFINGVRFASSE